MPIDSTRPYDDSNIFARILRGELPCAKVYEDEHVLAFNDIRPLADVHILAIPKGAYVSWDDFSERATPEEIAGFRSCQARRPARSWRCSSAPPRRIFHRSLCSLLKHPLAAGGEEQVQFRRWVRRLELRYSRGLRPGRGLEGIAARLTGDTDADLKDWFAKLRTILEPLSAALATKNAPLPDLVRAHVRAAECLAAPDGKKARPRCGAERQEKRRQT